MPRAAIKSDPFKKKGPRNIAHHKIEIDLDKVEELASKGLTIEQIAASLGISDRTLYSKKKRYAEIADAIKKGQAAGIATIANKLFQKAMGGNVAAMIFFLKARADWSDKLQIEGPGSGPLKVEVKHDAPKLSESQVQALIELGNEVVRERAVSQVKKPVGRTKRASAD